jgi:putative heme iron utilization protein
MTLPSSSPETRAEPVSPRPSAEMAAEALAILHAARHAALSYVNPADGLPAISRIAFGLCPDGLPLTLVSQLSAHHAGLAEGAPCAFMVGEPGPKGDPLTHPRLMVQAVACPLARTPALRDRWLTDHPKAALYIDFADFGFVRLRPVEGLWNGGFGKAARFAAADLAPSAG